MGNMGSVPNTHLFRDVFSSSPIGIAVESLEGQPLFVNPAFCSMLGFTEEELRSKHCVDFSPPEDAEKDWALFQQLRAGSIGHYQLDKRYFRRDGSLVWGRLSISLLKQTPPLIVAMVEDITEKKKAEEARFRHTAIVESSEDAIISKNLDAVIVSWNAGAQRIFGYTEEEAVGQPITILIPPNLQNEENTILERLRAGGRIEHYETVRVTKAGKWVDVSLSISSIKDLTGRIVGFIKIAHDITERKRAEILLHEANRALEKRTVDLQTSEELLKIFVKNVPAGVAMLDRDMRYLQVSDRWCADYSVLDSADVLGRSHYELFPDIPDHWKEVHHRALAGETLRAEEDRWDREGGTTWIRWEVRPWLKLDGLPGGILIFAENISHRKQMEEALSDMSGKLIEAHEEERTRIARELHDDINQRVALLAVNLQTLKQDLPVFEKKASGQIEEICECVANLGSDIQALSHRLHSSKLDYLGLVSAARGFCMEFSLQQRVETTFHSEDIPNIPVEVALCLFRVLQEALQNAVKHSGVKQFEVSLKGSLHEIDLVVHDSGSGFDAERAMKEHGLGLTSMRERLRLAGGQLFIESKPERGTTIHARVPFRPKVKSAEANGST